jgi:hypothetical protein
MDFRNFVVQTVWNEYLPLLPPENSTDGIGVAPSWKTRFFSGKIVSHFQANAWGAPADMD